jgi:putative OmpL-like beta-barrel porin-2
MYKYIFLMVILLIFSKNAVAEDSNNNSDFKFSGYTDGSYNYLLNSKQFTSGTNDRVFDINENGFTLQQASLTLAYQPKQGFGGLFNPVIGRDTYTFAQYGWNPDYGSQWVGFAIPQAFLQYSVNSFILMAGNFLAIVGAESLQPINDTNFSRSILYGYAEPFTVTGLRAIYSINDKLNFIIGINDGWDNIRDWSRRKTLELGLAYTINPIFSFSLQGYTGQERATPASDFGPDGIRSLIDFVGTINATKKLSFVINYDYGWQTKASLPEGNLAEAVWQGIAGYINYKFNEKWLSSIRGEIFSDRNGFRTGVLQCWKELTLTFGYIPIKNLELRAETRHDYSNVASFISKNNITTSHNQQSYALEAFYKFG